MAALLFSPLVEVLIVAAHLILPARDVDGYVCDAKGKPLGYRLNGLPVLGAAVAGWAGCCSLGVLPWDYLYTHVWEMCISACIMGMACTAYLVAAAPEQTRSTNLLADVFLGRTLNPRLLVAGRLLDIKMVLYVIGAVHLELNVLSYVAAHRMSNPDPNPGVVLCAGFLTWFACEYLYWENVHLYTYDLFAERVGFKLVWGCMCFYPFFYAIGLAAAVNLPNPHRSAPYYIFSAIVYFGGWAISRTANLQKFRFKQASARRVGNKTAAIRSADGKHELFCGGLWGAARHVNYVGEILEAVGIALAVGYPTAAFLPWLYPLYYVGLLVARERDDDARCREKYGPLWEEYCRRVPYRLVPFLY